MAYLASILTKIKALTFTGHHGILLVGALFLQLLLGTVRPLNKGIVQGQLQVLLEFINILPAKDLLLLFLLLRQTNGALFFRQFVNPCNLRLIYNNGLLNERMI